MKPKQFLALALISFLFFHFTNTCVAQQQIQWNWYFGEDAALNFSSGSPVAVAGSVINTSEGCASISDASGNLLFYTDGIFVWNKNNIQMPNGNGLLGNSSTTQSAIIVPHPDSANIYYIFTAPEEGTTLGINYDEVDMTLNGGLGDVTVKNVQLLNPTCEKLVAIRHCNGTDYWVIAHGFPGNSYYAWQVTQNAILAPVITNIGVNIPDNFSKLGYLKASPNGKKLLNVEWDNVDTCNLFDFDNQTGIVSNCINLPLTGQTQPYGGSFSPNDSVVYIDGCCSNSNLYQYDISSNNQATINASRYLVTSALSDGGALQIGVDNKLYVTSFSPSLSVINNPNVLGAGCNFVANAVSLGNGSGQLGLPNFVDAYIVTPPATSENDTIVTCLASDSLSPTGTGSSYIWNTGATTESISVDTSGLYWVQVIGATACSQTVNITDTFNVTFSAHPTVNLGNDSSVCGNGPVTLNAANPGDTYTWSTGATTETISVTTTGMYHVTVSNGGCTSTDSVTITFIAAPTVNLGPDTTLCEGQTITLNAGNPGMNYLWNTGATTQTITADSTASYSVTVTLGACTGADTINVTILNPPVVNLGPDKTLCLGEYSTLNAGNPGATYLWSDGSTLDTLHVTSSGQYWVLVSAGTCIGSDTINIIFNTSVTVNLGPDVKLCPGQTVTLNAGNPGEVYLWNTGATTQTIVASITGLYSVAVGSGVCTSRDTVSVLIYITPPVPLSNDTFICPGDQIELQAGKNYATYYWVPGNGGTYSMIVYQPGTYFVYVTDTNGCPSEGSILVQNFCQGNLYIPNTFTPNGNGNNDMFNPICESCVAFHMYIFDRWGETLFESTDIAQGWDGTFQGNNVPQGVYIYRIDYQLYDYLQLLKHTVYGNVNLIR